MADNIKLSRELRAAVLRALKANPGWPDYMLAQGLQNVSHNLKRDQIIAACNTLGVDIVALRNFKWADSAVEIADSDETPETESEETMPAQETPRPAPSTTVNAAPGFEGRDRDELLAEILAPAEIHMSGHLKQMLPALLKDLAAAAVVGPRTVIKTIRQGVTDSALPTPSVTRRAPLGDAFNLKRKERGGAKWRNLFDTIMVNVCDYDGGTVDAGYVWTPEFLAMLGLSDMTGQNIWLNGPAGVGKTEGVRCYAARLRRPFIRIPINRTTEPVDLLGQKMPSKDGGTVWKDGALTQAFRTPHCVVLIDEPTLLRSGTLAFLQTALDMRQLYLSSGEVVDCAEGVFFVAADNTAGTGDETGRYVDTSPINVALSDRFAYSVNVTYLDLEREIAMLAQRSGLVAAACRPMCEYAKLTRNDADSGKLTIGITPRRLLAWARAVKVGVTSEKAFTLSVINASDPADRECLVMLASQNLTSAHSVIDNLAHGTPIAAQPSAIGAVFPDDDSDVVDPTL